MEEPYWLPRTAEEYLQQVAEDSGPQPDETALLQRDIDAAEAEVARLTARLAERDAEVARLVASWQRAGDLLPYTLHRSECFQYVKGPGYCSCGLLDVIRDYGRAALAARGDQG